MLMMGISLAQDGRRSQLGESLSRLCAPLEFLLLDSVGTRSWLVCRLAEMPPTAA